LFVEVIIVISRISIIYLSVYMFQAMNTQKTFEFLDFEILARWTRLVLTFNVFYCVTDISYAMTLVWEKASEFIDLIEEVWFALLPFLVFLFLYIIAIFLAIYMFGQQQVGFDYYYQKNQGDIEEGIIRDCESHPDDCDTRYAEQLADNREFNKEEVPYDNWLGAFLFVYQMLMGDATHEYFKHYEARKPGAEGDPNSITPYILYVLYLGASFLVMIIMLNIIIAIMGNTQTVRTELKRKVIYRN
jgi:hypothetical protein